MRALAAATLAAAAAAAPTAYYQNPTVLNADSPDPGVAWVPEEQLWYSVTTGGDARGNFVIRTSPNLANWTDVGVAFPTGSAPKWASDSFWAPELHLVNGAWMLIHTARHSGNGLLSIGIAASTTGRAAGPYADALGAPLLMDPAGQGTIDATIFGDVDGRMYVIAKTDGNADGKPTPIHIAELDVGANGTRLAPGESLATFYASTLITDDQPWENGITEAPWVVRFGTHYYLFYSGSGYTGNGQCSYAVGVARATSVRGPYTKHGPPVLANATGDNPTWQGPGHASIVQAPDGGWAIVYHAWPGAVRSYGRHMMLDGLTWVPDDGGVPWPVVNGGRGPSVGAMPVP